MTEQVIQIKIKQDNGEVRILGTYKPSIQTLLLRRSRSKHFYRELSAWGIDEKALTGLKEKGLQFIVLYDTDTRSRVKATVEDFIAKGVCLHFKPYRLQRFLPEQYWTKDRGTDDRKDDPTETA